MITDEDPQKAVQLPEIFVTLDLSTALPNLGRFAMLTTFNMLRTGRDRCDQAGIKRFIKYDILKDRTYIMPFHELALPLAHSETDELVPMRAFRWTLLRDENDEVLVGCIGDMEEHMDGSWAKTNEGVRCPTEYRINPEPALSEGLLWKKHEGDLLHVTEDFLSRHRIESLGELLNFIPVFPDHASKANGVPCNRDAMVHYTKMLDIHTHGQWLLLQVNGVNLSLQSLFRQLDSEIGVHLCIIFPSVLTQAL